MTVLVDLLVLATESGGVPGTHIAARIAFPLGVLFFGGSVFLLLWSNYGWKKGLAIYGTAFFAFTMMLGVFWWFGAPGTPRYTGLLNLPGQPSNQYMGRWYTMEPGSERAGFFPATNSFENFQTLPEFIGNPDATPEMLEEDDFASFLNGELSSATTLMTNEYLPTDANGNALIGGQRRAEYLEAAGEPPPGFEPASPFFTATVEETRVTQDQGLLVAAGRLQTYANFVNPDSGETEQVPVDGEGTLWFAFKDPGALWFPSALWTGVSFLLFAGSLFALDRLEQSEKRARAEVHEPEDVAVPIAQ